MILGNLKSFTTQKLWSNQVSSYNIKTKALTKNI